MTMCPPQDDGRICVADCGKPAPECHCKARIEPTVIGWDLSGGVETHVEGFWKDGVLHITDQYEIIDHNGEAD